MSGGIGYKDEDKYVIKMSASSHDDYILPGDGSNFQVPKFKLGSANYKFEEVWSKSFNGDLNGTANIATYASSDISKGTIEERFNKITISKYLIMDISLAKNYLSYPHSFVYIASPSDTYLYYDCIYSNGNMYYYNGTNMIKIDSLNYYSQLWVYYIKI